MSLPPTAIAEMPLEAKIAPRREGGGFFGWLRRLFVGTPARGGRPTAAEAESAAIAATIESAAPTVAAGGAYITAPGGYRIRLPQPDEVHHGIDRQMIDSVRDGLSLIPPLPHVVVELLKEIQNPSATAASVGAIAATDPAMAASLIRTVNSAAFALHRKITSVSDAVNYLGFASVKAMVLHLQLEQALGKGAASNPDLQDLWVHSMMVSYIADALAKRVSGVDRGFVSTLGLLHDIGKVVVLTRFPKEADALRQAHHESAGSLEAERSVLGVDHADLGANVAAKWGLPADLVRAIRFHHVPHRAFEPTDPKPLHQAMFLVQIANQLAKYCYVYADEMEIDLVDKFALDAVGLGPDVTSLLDDPSVRAAASRAIFFAQEGSQTPASKTVRRFLLLHRGPGAGELLQAQSQAGDVPQQVKIDDERCDALFAESETGSTASARRFRCVGTASDSGLTTLAADIKRQMAKLDLPSDLKLPLALVERCLLANVPRDAKQQVEMVCAAEGGSVQFGFRSEGIGFASRFGPDADPAAAARVLDSELANVLNLKWFDSITTSTDGNTLVFTTSG